MPISLVFTINREIIRFLVVDKNIFYCDRKFKNYIRCLPRPENFLSQIKLSRNKFPSFLAEMFKFSEKDMEQFNSSKDEDELATIVINDARLKGCKLLYKTQVTKEQLGDLKFIS